MADQLGMEFANWQNAPSLMDALNKQASATFKNPLLSAIGYGINQLTGQQTQQQLQNIPGSAPAPSQTTIPQAAIPTIPQVEIPTLPKLEEPSAQPIDYTKFLYSR